MKNSLLFLSTMTLFLFNVGCQQLASKQDQEVAYPSSDQDRELSSSYLVFVRDIFSDNPILPSTKPSQDNPSEILEPGQPVKLSASLGESESLGIGIYNEGSEDIKSISVTVKPLTHLEDQSDLLEEVNVGVVKIKKVRPKWTQPAAEPNFDSRETILPYSPAHIANGEFDIPSETSKEWLITVRIPESALPGEYQSTIMIKPEDSEASKTTEIPFSLTVYPVKLRPAKQLHGLYYRPPEVMTNCQGGSCEKITRFDYRDIKTLEAFREVVKADFQLMQEMGLQTFVAPPGSTWTHWNEQTQKFDYKLEFLEVLFQEAKRYGLANAPIPVSVRQGKYQELFDLTRSQPEARALTEEELYSSADEHYKEMIKAIQALADRYEVDIFYDPVDEPFHAKAMKEKQGWLKRLAPLIREAVPQAKIWTTINFRGWYNEDKNRFQERFQPYIDVEVYSKSIGYNRELSFVTLPAIEAHLQKTGDLGYVYYNQYLGTPYLHRIQNGIFLWNTPLAGNVPWSYQAICEDAYLDELTCDGSQADWLYAYPDNTDGFKPLPTLRLIGMREGADDIRYLNALEQAIKEAPASKAKEKTAAEQLLNDIKALINERTPHALGIMKLIPPSDMLEWRKKIVEAVMALEKTN